MENRIFKLLVLVAFVFISSCERESTCETKTECFSDGNGGQRCIEKPIPGTCVENNFGF